MSPFVREVEFWALFRPNLSRALFSVYDLYNSVKSSLVPAVAVASRTATSAGLLLLLINVRNNHKLLCFPLKMATYRYNTQLEASTHDPGVDIGPRNAYTALCAALETHYCRVWDPRHEKVRITFNLGGSYFLELEVQWVERYQLLKSAVYNGITTEGASHKFTAWAANNTPDGYLTSSRIIGGTRMWRRTTKNPVEFNDAFRNLDRSMLEGSPLALATKGDCNELVLVQLDNVVELNLLGAHARVRSNGTTVALATPDFGTEKVLIVSDIKAVTATAGRKQAIMYDDNYLPLCLAFFAFVVARIVGAGDIDQGFLHLLAFVLGVTGYNWSPGSSRWAMQNPSTGTCLDKLLDQTRGNAPRFSPDSIAQLVRNGWYTVELIDSNTTTPPAPQLVRRVCAGVNSCDFAASYLPHQWALQLDLLNTVGIDGSGLSIGDQLPTVAGTPVLAGGSSGARAFKPLRGPRRDLREEWRPSRAVERTNGGGSALMCPSLLAPLIMLILLLLKAEGLAGGSGWVAACVTCTAWWYTRGAPIVHTTQAGPN
jgi:hypothetical protein